MTQPSRSRPPLTSVEGSGNFDLAAAEAGVHDLLAAFGVDLEDESLQDTPRRVAAAFAEFLKPRPFRLTTFPNDEGYDELIIARNIRFHSLCEHHLLPFVGY